MSFLHLILLSLFTAVSALLPLHTFAYMHLMTLARRYHIRPGIGLSEPPMVTVQLPIYNERYVVDRLIESVCNLDYPRDRLEIIVADDSDDDTAEICAKLVEKHRRKGFNIVHLRRDGRRDFKAGALQNALKHSHGDFIAIFDADFIPPRDFIKRVLPYFHDERVGLVQARWGHLNRDYSPLTSAQALALDLHFKVEQMGRQAGGLFLNFNGTAGVWRRSCIIDCGGWVPSLAEDLDLSYRAQLRGWKLVYVDDVVAPAEIPVQVNAARRQQYRWAFGAVQTTLRYLGMVIFSRISLMAKVHAFIHLTRHIPQLLLTVQVLLVPLVIRDGSLSQSYAIIGFMSLYPVLVVVSMLLVSSSFVKATYPKMTHFLRDVLLLIVWGTGTSVNNSIAVIHALVRGDIVFERTPKFGIVRRGMDWRHMKYALPFEALALADILIGVYALYASLYAYYARALYFLPLTTIFSASILLTGFATIAHSRHRVKPIPYTGRTAISRLLFIALLTTVSLAAALSSYTRTSYSYDVAAGYLENASAAAEMEDSIQYVDSAIKLLPTSGNPVWILPTPHTDLSLIRHDLIRLRERMVTAIMLEHDTEYYHATFEDVRGALTNIGTQLRSSMPYAWLGPYELLSLLIIMPLSIAFLVRR
jgi:cellulose synthase/poly-beta-1,6-N-acetylglucosamine synthase-like glycosyltransferase